MLSNGPAMLRQDHGFAEPVSPRKRRLQALIDYVAQTARTRSKVVSNVTDYGLFLRMLLNRGRLGTTRILTEKSAKTMFENHTGNVVVQRQVSALPALSKDFPVGAGEDKWGLLSGVVLLLPHGYEGQGPEHSSARPERILEAAADVNLRLVNCTTAAQYFHVLRRQAALLETDPLPLFVLTPKSLLRHPAVASAPRELAEGQFRPVIDDVGARTRPREIRRLVLARNSTKIKTRFGAITVKLVVHPDGFRRAMPEYDDLKRIAAATKLPLKQVHEEVLRSLGRGSRLDG